MTDCAKGGTIDGTILAGDGEDDDGLEGALEDEMLSIIVEVAQRHAIVSI